MRNNERTSVQERARCEKGDMKLEVRQKSADRGREAGSLSSNNLGAGKPIMTNAIKSKAIANLTMLITLTWPKEKDI